MYEMSRRKRIFKWIYIFILSLFPPDRTVQSGARTHRVLMHYFHIGPALPVLSTLHFRCLRIIPTSGPRYRCLVRDSTSAYASPRIELTLPASTHHPASNSHYRHLCITRHRTHATSAYASPRIGLTLPAPTHHPHHAHATGTYASHRIELTLPASTHHPASDSCYRRL